MFKCHPASGEHLQPPEEPELSGARLTQNAAAGDYAFGITSAQWNELLENGRAAQEDPGFDARPVVKLCRADGSIQLLLAEVEPESPDLAFGLVELGRWPLLRFINLRELAAEERGNLCAAEYQSDLSLTEAALSAQREDRIRDYAAEPCPLCDLTGAASLGGFQRVRLHRGRDPH